MIISLSVYESSHTGSAPDHVPFQRENPMNGELKYRWLVAGNVVAAGPKGTIGQKGFNTLVSTDKVVFTRKDMATAQHGLMQRFVDETQKGFGSKESRIVDVLLLSVTNLGLMTETQFNDGLELETVE